MSAAKGSSTDKSLAVKQTRKLSIGRQKSTNSSQIASVGRQISGSSALNRKGSAGRKSEVVNASQDSKSRQKTSGRPRNSAGRQPKSGIVMNPDEHVYQFVAYQTSLPFEAFNVSYSREASKATTRCKGQKDGDVSEMLLSELWVGYDEGSFAFVAKKKFRSYSRFLVSPSFMTNQSVMLETLVASQWSVGMSK